MLNKNETKLVCITALGGLLEYYDFIIFALMTPYLADQFFPWSDPYTSLLLTFTTFAAGYFSRPLGGLVFGHIGDRHGRKKTFSATIFIMALSTALMGCLPTYQQAGFLAPVLLTTLRLIQGFSIGGEIPGAITFLSENTEKHLGLVIALLISGILCGLVTGSLVHNGIVHLLGNEAMADWGWRLPFWLGGMLGVISYVIRKQLQESRLFLLLDKNRQQQPPVLVLIKSYKKMLLTGMLLIVPANVCLSLLFLFTPGYLTRLLDYDARTVIMAGCTGILSAITIAIFSGWLADRKPEKSHVISLHKWGNLIVIFSSIPIFTAFAHHQLSVYVVFIISSLTYGSVAIIGPLLLSTAFPVAIRYSGIAFAYNACLAIFGGLTPVIAMTLIKTSGNLSSPSYYLVFSGFCGLAGCQLMRRNANKTSE